MKKLQSLFIGIIAIIVILFFGVRQLEKASGMAGADTLTIYNWGDYIDPALIKKFEKKQAIKSITKPLILMKLCIQKFSKVAQPMILPFLLNI